MKSTDKTTQYQVLMKKIVRIVGQDEIDRINKIVDESYQLDGEKTELKIVTSSSSTGD